MYARFLTGTLLFCFCLTAITTSAQTAGSMRGLITDEEGKPIPGATVIISSPALIGQTRTAYTNEQGVFRFPSLPVGAYAVEVTMEGFEKVRVERVDVGLEATAYVPVSMKFSTVAESVTVLGDTPILDVTKAGISTNIKGEMLEEVPTQRQMTDLMQVQPGMSVDVGDSLSGRIVAFGSNRQSNSWNIDGVDVTAPETGAAWWFVNPDAIEEIQIIGTGAPAEYGNHTGAVFNVVTRKGGNELHGSLNYFFEHDSLTDTNVKLPDSEFVFHRDVYRDVAFQLGGPIKKDRIWFFGALEHWRDGNTQPGNDPRFTPVNKSDKADLKISARIGENHELTGFVHHEEWDYPEIPSPFVEPSALSGERGSNPAWGAGLTSTLSADLLLELNYAGWWSDDIHDSQTGSMEDPFIDYTPPGGGTTYSGGVWYPWDYVTWRNQFKGKATYYADDFLRSQHEFKFGVQYSRGSALTNVGIGPNGVYTYNYYGYLYQARQDPYQYGGISNELGFFVDDSIHIGDRLTLNLGLRFDHITGHIPDYERLTIGEPSVSPSGRFKATGEKIPGIDFVNWDLWSPRMGFVYQLRDDGKSVLQGSFGVYYDHNVIGNWDSPPPQRPLFRLYAFNPDTQQFDILVFEETPANIGFNTDLRAPKTFQYSLGYEHQFFKDMAAGIQFVYKDTSDLVGWEILGGSWEPVVVRDPITGREYTLLSQVEVPLLRKGNRPGDFPGGENLDYYQEYTGLVLTLEKRFSDKWAINANYTWSRSEGLIPRMLSQFQFNPFYSSREGSDPNNFINADGRLQGDRPHMFRVQAVFFKLPWDMQLSTSMEFSSGRHHTRLARFRGLGQGTAVVIMERGLRYSPIQNVDITIGKRFYIKDNMFLRLEGTIYNLLNSDQELTFSTLELGPGETFVPDLWVKPRRLLIRLGFHF